MEPSDKDAQAPSLEVALFRESILRGSMRTGRVLVSLMKPHPLTFRSTDVLHHRTRKEGSGTTNIPNSFLLQPRLQQICGQLDNVLLLLIIQAVRTQYQSKILG